MSPSVSSSKPCFRVEGLEARILLSAAPMDGGIDSFDEPDVFERVEVDDDLLQQMHSGAAGDDGLWEGVADNEAAVFTAEDDLILESGSSDPFTDLDVAAPSVRIGDSIWSGNNVIRADSIDIVGNLIAEAGATLTLIPGSLDADITLGKDAAGFALSSAELQRLAAAGFAELIIGSKEGSHSFTIDGLSYQGNLTLQAPLDGGSFDVLSTVAHSGGQLTYIGPGATQNTSADTNNEGDPILINDSVQLVYTVENENTIRMVTTHNNNPNGADIAITGDILGSSEGRGGKLILDAGNQGTIFIGGNIGTSAALESLEIINAREVIIEGNVQVDSLLIQDVQTNVTFGTSASNFVRIDAEENAPDPGDLNITAANNITFEGDIEIIGGDAVFNITGTSGTRQLWIKGEISVDAGDLNIERAGRVLMSSEVSVSGQITQVAGVDNSLFESSVIAGSVDMTATNQIRFGGQLDLTAGDLLLTTNNVDFRGGNFTVIGAVDSNENPISNAHFRPFQNSGNMNIGAPVGAGTNFTFSTTDIAAIADGWQSITFGYQNGSTNLARVGTAEFLDRVTMYAGSFLINGPLSAKTSLDLNAETGNIDVRSGANIRVENEEVDEVFQSSRISFLAQQGDIEFRNAARLLIDNNDDADTDQGSLIELEATNGRIVDLSASPNRQEAREIDLLAAHAISLHTSVEELTAHSTVSGSITINEIDALRVHSAVTQNGAISMVTGGVTELELLQSLTDSSANAISVTSLGDIEVGELRAGVQGNVTLTVEGSITRLEDELQNLMLHLIQGNHLSLTSESGQGTASDPLEVRVNRITSSNSNSGAIRIDQLVGRGNLELAVTNMAESSNAFIGIQVATGTSVTVNATGIRSDADAGIALTLNGGALQVIGDVTSQGGAIAFQATQQFNQSSGSTIESNGGDILLDVGSTLSMAIDAAVLSGSGSIVLDAGGSVTLGVIDARVDEDSGPVDAGHVAIFSGGQILDHMGSDATNIFANELQLVGATGVGQLPSGSDERAIETDAFRMAVQVQGGVIAIHDKGDLNTGVVSAVDLDLIELDGSHLSHSGQSPPAGVIHAAGGDILIQVAGQLTLESNEAATDSVAVHTQGGGRIVILAGTLIVEDTVRSEGGAIVMEAANAIEVTGDTVVGTTGTATIAVESVSDDVAFAADTIVSTGSGDIVIAAEGSMTLGSLSTTGSVGLRTEEGSIRSAAGGDNDRVVVTANSLAIVSGGLVNGATDSGATETSRQLLLTHVATLSLAGVSGSHHRIHNSRALTVNTTSARADRYSGLMEFTDFEITDQSNFAVSGQGHIEVLVDGNFILAASRSVETTGSGSILMSADGTFSMGTLSVIQNESGAIQLSATGTVAIAKVESVDGAITVSSSNGAIIDSDPTEVTVVDFATEGQLTLSAETGIGIQSGDRDTLQVLLGTLSASTVSGGIFISSQESFNINGLETTGTVVPVSIVSGGSISISGTTDATGDVVIRADTDLTQSTGSVIRSGVDIALRSGADMTLHRVETPANVALEVDGALMGTADPQQSAVAANGLLLNGVGTVGTPAQPLHTTVSRLAGEVTGGSLALANTSALALGPVISGNTPVGTADTLPAAEQRVQSADRILISGEGSGFFLNNSGSLLTEAVGDAILESLESIPVLLQSSGQQTWNGHFELGGGPVTLRSDASITLLADGEFKTGGGSILIESTGAFGIGADSSLNRSGGDLIIDSGSDILIAGLIFGADRAALIAADRILAAATGGIEASELILRASQAIGSADDFLVTSTSYLSAHTGASGVFLENSGNLRITNLGFAVSSLTPGGVENIAFSGIQGGVVARAAGEVQIANNGSVIVDPIAASIIAFPGSSQSIAFFADEDGSSQNGAQILFEVVRSDSEPIDADPNPEEEDLRTGNPPSTLLQIGENTIDLQVFVRNGVSTLAEIVDAINAETGFPWTAVLVSGAGDGSNVFTLATDADANFISTGGSEQGIQSQVAANFSGGAEAISATAGIIIQGATYTINVTADEAGAEANSYVVRILDEGPIDPLDGGRLNPNTNSANIEWDGEEYLDIYINFGYTTVATIIERINSQEGIPFTAQIGGVFETSDLDAVVGDAPVLMESDLRAEATFRPQGSNNDFRVVATSSGSLYNGIQFIFVDNGTVPENGAVATFNGVTNRMTIQIQSGVSTANQVIAAINAQGTFSATLVPELNAPNNGSGAIQATRFFTTGGAVEVAASANLRMVGGDNDIVVTSKELGDDWNGYEIRFVSDESLAPGQVVVQHQQTERRILLTVNPAFTSAAAVESAINAVSSLPFTADANDNVGTIIFSGFPLTSGGSGSTARADFSAAGNHNDFALAANEAIPSLVNIRVFLIDDGSITNGSANAQYFTDTRFLIVNLQSGVTTANTVIAAINDNPNVPVTATLAAENNGSGVYFVEATDFSGGIEAISASVSYTLPSGVSVQLVADEGGVTANGVQVSFAIDDDLEPGSASVNYFESGGMRILQLRVASELTPIEVLRDALENAESIPLSLIVDSADLGAGLGAVATTEGDFNEGRIGLQAVGDILLLGRIQSQTGGVVITSTNGDVVFGSEFTRIEAIDAVVVLAGGSLANLASIERPLITVYGDGTLQILTGSQDLVSTEALELRSYGDIFILGAGLAIEDGFEREMPILLDADWDILIDAPLTVVPVADDADGVVIEVIKSTTDGEGHDLTSANPVAISLENGTYKIYVLPGVATHANIVDALNAFRVDDVQIFFSTLGRQQGSLNFAGHSFFFTAVESDVIETVNVFYANLGSDSVQASFSGTTLDITLGAFDNTSVADLLAALNALNAFNVSTSSPDTSVLLRGADARNFSSDYTIEIVAATEDGEGNALDSGTPVRIGEVDGTFTIYALAGVATRLDIQNALSASGWFGASVPNLNAELVIGDVVYFLNTGMAAVDSVNLEFRFVESGLVDLELVDGVLEIGLNNIDPVTGQDLLEALQGFGFTVYTFGSDLDVAFDVLDTDAAFAAIPDSELSAALDLTTPITATLPVGSEGVFAETKIEIEGLLLLLNWRVPVLTASVEMTTADDSLSQVILDDGSTPTATLEYGVVGNFASTVLAVDGVNVAIAARSASIHVYAGDLLFITDDGVISGGSTELMAGGMLQMHGAITGGSVTMEARGNILQTGTIQTVGAANVNVSSTEGSVIMAGSASTITAGGNILYQAAEVITLVYLASTDGGRIDVSAGESIIDSLQNDDLNLSTSGLITLTAQEGIGAIEEGAIQLESGSLQLRNFGDSGDIVVTEVASGGNLVVIELTQNAIEGWSILTALGGSVLFTGPVIHIDEGALLVEASGDIETNASGTIVLNGGDLTMFAGDSISLNADIHTNGGAVWILADVGSVEMVSTMTLNAGGGNVLVAGYVHVVVAQIRSDAAAIRAHAETGSILRAANDGRTNFIAATLQLLGGSSVGSLATGEAALITDVQLLTVTAAGGVLALRELNDLEIGESSVSVNYSVADRSFGNFVWSEDQILVESGNAVIRVGGALSVQAITAAMPTLEVAGDLRVQAQQSITVTGDALISSGSVEMVSGTSFSITGDLDVSAGTLLIQVGSDFSQGVNSSISVADHNAVIRAGQSITVNHVDTGAGHLALTAVNGGIIRNAAAPAIQLFANHLRLQSNAAIATFADPLVLDVTRLSALAKNSIHLRAQSDLTVDAVEVTVDTVSVTGSTSADPSWTAAVQSDLRSSAGGNILMTVDGLLTLNEGQNANGLAVEVNADGQIHLAAEALIGNANIRSVSGHATVAVSGNASWTSGAELLSTSGDLLVNVDGNLQMHDLARMVTQSGNIGIGVGGNFSIANVEAASGYVLIQTAGSLTDAGDSRTDIVADRLQIESGAGVGTLSAGAVVYNPIEISANRISAFVANGPLAVNALGSIEVGLTTGTVSQVALDGSTEIAFDAINEQYGILSTGGGSVSVVVAETLTVLSDGAALAGIEASGAGNVVLNAAAITVQDDVTAGNGHVTIQSTNALVLGTDTIVSTAANGSVSILSQDSSITQQTGSLVSSVDGDIVLSAQTSVAVAFISTDASVSIRAATGSINDVESSSINVESSNLRLYAQVAIGTGANPLDTEVGTLSARTLNGGAFLNEAVDVTIGTTGAVTWIVAPNNTLTQTVVADQSGIATGGSNGTISLLAGGTVTVVDAVSASQAGRILVDADGGIDLQANVSSGSGSMTFLSGATFSMAAGVTATTAGVGEIHVSADAEIQTAANSRFVNVSGNVVLASDGDLVLGGILSEARVVLVSFNGSILSAGSNSFNYEVVGTRLLLSAVNGGVGSLFPTDPVNVLRTQVNRVAAEAGAGGINVLNAGNLLVDVVSVEYRLVNPNGSQSAAVTLSLSDLTTFSGNGSIVLRSTGGNIILTGGNSNTETSISAHGSGRIHIAAEHTSGNVTINADILSGGGSISVLAGNNILQNADIISSGSNDIDLQTFGGSITMGAAYRSETSGLLVYRSATHMTIGQLEAFRVYLNAGESIFNAGVAGLNIVADDLQLVAGQSIGEAEGVGNGRIKTRIDLLAARAVAGNIYLIEEDGLLITSLSSIDARRVTSQGAVEIVSGEVVAGISAPGEVSIEFASGGEGTVIVDEPIEVSAGEGNLQLYTLPDSGSVIINAWIYVETGNITINAHSDIVFQVMAGVRANDNPGVENDSIYAGGTIDLIARTGSILMDETSYIQTAGKNIRAEAANNIRFNQFDARTTADRADGSSTVEQNDWGSVSLIGNAGVVNPISFNADRIRVYAQDLRIEAGGQIGEFDNFKIEAQRFAAQAGSNVAIQSVSGVEVASVADVQILRVDQSGVASTFPATPGPAMNGIATTALNGSILFETLSGNLNVSAPVATNGTGDLRFNVASGNATFGSSVTVGGVVSLLAHGNIQQTSGFTLNGSSSVDVESSTGTITMADGASATAATQLRYRAPGNITVGQLSASALRISTEGSILDGGNAVVDLIAQSAQLTAGGAIGQPQGTALGRLNTDIGTLAATAGSGIYILDAGTLTLGSVSAIQVVRIGANGTETLVTGSSLSGISVNGAAIITAATGIVVQNSLSVNTGGVVLLRTTDSNSDIIIRSSVQSAGGSISIIANRHVILENSGLVLTVGSGTVDIEAVTGGIQQQAGLQIRSGGGSILLRALGDISLGIVDATSNGRVGVQSHSGSILDSKVRTATGNNIIASVASLLAAGDIGRVGDGTDNAIEISATTLTARTTAGGSIHISALALRVDTVASFSVNRVAASTSTSTSATTVAAQSDVRTSGNGHIILRSAVNATLNGGLSDSFSGIAVSAGGTGNILIHVITGNSGINVNAAVQSESGNISIRTGNRISAAGSGNIRVLEGAGSIDLDAGIGTFTQSSNLTVQTAGGNITLRGNGNITIGIIDARTNADRSASSLDQQGNWGAVGIHSGNTIIDAKSNSATAVNIFANQAILIGVNGIGQLNGGTINSIETEVASLAAVSANGVIHIIESTDLSIETIASFTSNRVAQNATTSTGATTFAERDGLTAGSDLRVDSLNGSISIADGVIVSSDVAVYLNAADDLILGGVVAPQVRLEAGASISSGGNATLDVEADALQLIAGDSIGEPTSSGGGFIRMSVDTVAASAETGDIYLSNAGDLSLTPVEFTQPKLGTEGLAGLAAGGSIQLQVEGSLEIEQTITASTGDLRVVNSAGNITANATLTAGSHLYLEAANTLNQNADFSATGTLYARALTGSISMAADTESTAASVRYEAQGSVTLALLEALEGAAVISHSGDLIALAGVNINAEQGWLDSAGSIGSASAPLITNLDRIAVEAGSSAYIQNGTELEIGAVSVLVNQIAGDGSLDAQTAQAAGITTGGLLNLTNGDALQVVEAVDVGADLVLNATSIEIEADVTFGGDANLIAVNDLTLSAAIIGSGSLIVDAESGSLTLSASASIDVMAAYLGAYGNLTLASVDALLVYLSTDVGDLIALSGTNVSAESLAIWVGGSVAAESARLNIEVEQLALIAGGDAFISQTGSLEIATIAWAFRSLAIMDIIAEGSWTGSLENLEVDGQLDLIVSGALKMLPGQSIVVSDALILAVEGDIELTDIEAASATIQSSDGGITLEGSLVVTGSGSILLEAASGNLLVDGLVRSDSGHITLKASDSISLQSADVETSQPGTISLVAGSGSISMSGDSSIEASGSSLRLAAAGSITIGNLIATNVSIHSTAGAILNGLGSILNVSANQLRLEAAQSIGASGRHLSLSVQQLAARSASGSIFLAEASAVSLGTVSVAVTEIHFDGSTSSASDASLSGLQTGFNGHIVLETVSGNIAISQSVNANGSGNIRLVAAAGNLTVNAAVQSGSGHITLRASGSMSLAGVNVRTASAGHISLSTGSGALTMVGGSQVEAINSTVRIESNGNLTIGNLTATNISLIASSGSILNASGTQRNVTADNLRLQAQNNIGVAARRLSLNVAVLSAHSNGGDIFLTDSNSVTVGSVGVNYRQVSSTGSTISHTDASQAGLVTQANGRIQLQTTAGHLVVRAQVQAPGSGQVLLSAGSDSADLSVRESINAGSGRLTLLAGRDLNLSANLSSDGGDTFLQAASGSFTQNSGSIAAGDGDIRIEARSNALLRQVLNSGSLFVSSHEGSIQSQSYQSGNAVVISDSIRLEAAESIGTVQGGALLLRANRLQASADSGDLHIAVLGDVTIASISLVVDRALANGGSESIDYPTASDIGLSSGGNLLFGSNSDVRIESRIESSESIMINSDGWLRQSLSAQEPVLTADIVILNAGVGLGQTGSGALWIEADELTAISESGSVYLALSSDTSISTALARDFGSVFIQQNAGNLIIEGVVSGFGGGVNIRTVGHLTLPGSSVLADRNIDILAGSINASSAEVASTSGNVRIRSTGSLSLDTDSSVVATLGDIYLQSSNDLSMAKTEALGRVQLIAAGSVLSNANGDASRAVMGSEIRIRAGGSIGEAGSPLIVDSELLDLEGQEGLNLRSLSGLSLGVYGLKVETQVGETLRIEVDGGALSSNGGTIVDQGSGTFVLETAGTLEINTLVRSVAGSIRIVAERITHNGSASAVIEAPQGSIELVAETGIGSQDNPLYFLTPNIRAYSTTGVLNLFGLGSTRIGGEGLWIGGGNGLLQLRLASGNLSVESDLRHFGTGHMNVEVQAGALLMNASGRISTSNGDLRIVAQNDIRVARISSSSGNIVLESLGGSIRRIDGAISGGNLVSARSPVLRLVGIADLTVDANSVIVNDSEIFRRTAPFIPLFLTFSS